MKKQQSDFIWSLILDSSGANGDDFGILEEVIEVAQYMESINAQAVGGHVADFVKKGYLEVWATELVNGDEPCTQFVITEKGFNKEI